MILPLILFMVIIILGFPGLLYTCSYCIYNIFLRFLWCLDLQNEACRAVISTGYSFVFMEHGGFPNEAIFIRFLLLKIGPIEVIWHGTWRTSGTPISNLTNVNVDKFLFCIFTNR